MIRCLCGLIGYTTMVYGVIKLPLSTGTIITNTSPFWTVILGYFIIKEKVTKFEIICMLGCFTGVIILALTKREPQLEESETKDS